MRSSIRSTGLSQRSTRASPYSIRTNQCALSLSRFPGCGSLTAMLFALWPSLRMALPPVRANAHSQSLKTLKCSGNSSGNDGRTHGVNLAAIHARQWSAADETGEQHQRVPQLLIKIYLFGFVLPNYTTSSCSKSYCNRSREARNGRSVCKIFKEPSRAWGRCSLAIRDHKLCHECCL
jgi:hypothetical protein